MEELKDEDYRWVRGGSKSIALLWLRQKNQDLMQIANALKPQDPENEYEMDIFIDLVSKHSSLPFSFSYFALSFS